MRKIASLLVLTGFVAVLVSAGVGQAKTPVCNGTKIEPVRSGTYPVMFGSTLGSVTITANGLDAGGAFDFQTDAASHIVTSLAVKGGSVGAVVYTPNASSGTDLHAPLNPGSGTWYGLSNLCLETAEAPADGGGGGSE